MKLSEKKKAAERLYMETDMSQKEIATHIKVSENTLTNWVKKYKWDEIKKTSMYSQPQLITETYASILAIFKKAENENRTLTGKETNQLAQLGKLIRDMRGDRFTPSSIFTSVRDMVDSVKHSLIENEQSELSDNAFAYLEDGFIEYIKLVYENGGLLKGYGVPKKSK